MDTKDDPVSMEDTGAASHSEDVNNSKNNDNVESCSSKETEGIKQSQINENTAEVHDKSNEEENPGTCEKDSAVSNIETSDSTLDLETSKKNDNTEIETTLPENNSENVGTKESNAVENKEAEMALADTEVAELDIPNLTKNTDVLALEDLCKVPADAVNDDEKFINDNIITEESETSKEKTDDCDIPNKTSISDNVITESEISSKDTTKDIADESSTNKNVVTESEKPCIEGTKESNIPDENSSSVDDIQLLQKEDVLLNKTDGTNKKIESESSDSNLDNSEKDLPEKKSENTEPETTEFVQISHDKNDDSQIEVQPVDAEDPFGGDNLTSESIEQPETDNFVDSELSFKKLYEQDNLQNEIITEGNDCRNEKSNVDSATNDPKDIDIDKAVDNIAEASSNVQTVESLEVISIDTDLPGTSISETGTENILFPKSTNEQNVQGKKNIEQITTMETDEADVLPGQDDELCIIPDSMKVIMPSKSGKATDDNQIETELLKNFECTEITEKCSKSNLEREDTSNTSRLVTDNTNKDDSIVQQDVIIQDVSKLTTVSSILASDIINIDDGTKHSKVKQIVNKEACKQCGEVGAIRIRVRIGTQSYFVCSKTCKALFKAANIMSKILDIPSQGINTKQEKRCATCLSIIELNDERNLSWETMEFCNEECLGKFQRRYGSYCKNCSGTVQAVSLGKYCVRFGCDVRQFCCSTCLEEFKKGLKVCSYCQKDISVSAEGFLAPVGEKGQFKDFCTQDCMEKYSKLNSTEPLPTEKKLCSVCKEEKPVHREVQIYNSTPVAICSEPCFAAFKFVKQVKPEQCSTCKKFFELPNKQHFVVFYENEPHTFCNKTCLNIFIITNRKILPCNWCKVKKYNFDMIKKELKTGQVLMMCSLNCLTLYQVSINAVSAKRINCDLCKEYSLAHYHLTMSDATIRNFCSYNCVMNFQAQYTKSPITIPPSDDPVPAGLPKKTTLPQKSINQIVPNEVQKKKIMPVISSVTSLASMGNGQANQTPQQNNVVIPANANQTAPMVYKQQVITRPPSPAKMHNKMTQCKPLVHTKGVSVRPHPCTKGTQTTENVQQVLVPVPVPIYVPFPMHMYSMPFPVPMPFPLPIPVPLFIPTTRNSAKGIMKDIKKIQEKIPADPYEAELLMMAEMVATEKKVNDSDSDSVDDKEDDTADQDNLHSDGFSPEAVDSSNTFGDDMLQMALKMATGELDEPAVDLEAALTPNTITATQAPSQPENALDNDVQSERLMVGSRGRKRVMPYKPRTTATKRMRRVSGTNDMPLMPPPESQPPPQPRIMEPMEKPDANMALKYTFGVNAWRQWVVGKNAELEKQFTPMKKIKLFKTDLLQLTADELNYSLCLFVKEVRKPNGSEYAPDTIYYLCLGIQQYLFENNRIDNIFTDSYYEKFTDCLNEVAKKFSMLYNDAQYIVTRVEEEHLWECKQLGAHSPHVLLSTLMFFNTKHFNLVTVEEHMQLSFSHIMKHWKRNPAAQPAAVAGKVPGSRNVLLRFYPPQSALEANSRKKKVYEQQENEENPLRCPVKLYEFYLSKCPESVKTRNDVFYLLPERSCVPDSPVWYSTSPLAKEQLVKMLYRIKMVKEINVALLTS